MTTLNKTKTNEVIERFIEILKYVDDVNLLEVVYELLKNPNYIDLDGFGKYLDKLMNSQNFKIKDITPFRISNAQWQQLPSLIYAPKRGVLIEKRCKIDDLLQFIKDDKIKSILIEIYKKHHSIGRGGLRRKKRMSRRKKRMSLRKKRMSLRKKRMSGGDNNQCEICRSTWEEKPSMSTCHHIIINSLGEEIQHKFHSECLNDWYERKRTCPLCNTGDIAWINEARGDGVVCPSGQNQRQIRDNVLTLIIRYVNTLQNIPWQTLRLHLIFIALSIAIVTSGLFDTVSEFIDFLYTEFIKSWNINK